MLDLYKLKIFVLVTQTGSFTKTADALLLSQSAVSQHIKGLEQDFGTKLFDRGRSGAKLTKEGEILLGYAQQILELEATAVSAVTNIANLKKGQLRLGIAVLAGNYILPTWVHTFRQQYPNLRVLLKTIDSESLQTALNTEQLDLGFFIGWGSPENAMLGTKPFREVDVALIVGKRHHWHDREQLYLREIDGQPLVMRPAHRPAYKWLDALFTLHKVRPKIVLISDELEAIKRTVIEGQCAAFLPLCAISKELDYGDLFALSVPEITNKPMLTLAWNRKRPFTPISRAFIAHLSETYTSLRPLIQ